MLLTCSKMTIFDVLQFRLTFTVSVPCSLCCSGETRSWMILDLFRANIDKRTLGLCSDLSALISVADQYTLKRRNSAQSLKTHAEIPAWSVNFETRRSFSPVTSWKLRNEAVLAEETAWLLSFCSHVLTTAVMDASCGGNNIRYIIIARDCALCASLLRIPLQRPDFSEVGKAASGQINSRSGQYWMICCAVYINKYSLRNVILFHGASFWPAAWKPPNGHE